MTRCEYLIDPTAGVHCDAEPAYRAEPYARTRDGADLVSLGRPISRGSAYCDAHGGMERSRAERDSSWHYLAPASVGDEADVLDAGTLALDSTCVYVVVRHHAYETTPERVEVVLTDQAHEALRARLGPSLAGWACPRRTLGSGWRAELRLAVYHAGAIEVHRAGQPVTDEELADLEARGVLRSFRLLPARVRERAHPYAVSLGVGSHTLLLTETRTEKQAIAIGRADWRRHVDQTVARIREARGGTLDWGMPIRPLAEPIIVRPEPGESAWDALERLRP